MSPAPRRALRCSFRREAIHGYHALEAQPGTPGWLKAASEYEIAEIYAALRDNDFAVAALDHAVQLGFDDCLTPPTSDRLKTILQDPKATQALARMQITQADFGELIWLKAEVQHAHHDARMMIAENVNRRDHQPTEIPQSQLPTRATTSPAVLYARQQLLMVQSTQRDFVRKADILRIQHATKMAIIAGGTSQTAVVESARRALLNAKSRKMEIDRRAFVPRISSSDQPRPCSEFK
jgi:hypothetical protein